MTKHFVNWDGLDFKEEESDYNKYHRKPDHFKETFVGPRNTWGGARRGAGCSSSESVGEGVRKCLVDIVKAHRCRVDCPSCTVRREVDYDIVRARIRVDQPINLKPC